MTSSIWTPEIQVTDQKLRDELEEDLEFQIQELVAGGYTYLGIYDSGIEFTAAKQFVSRNFILIQLKSTVPLPYTTTGNWEDEEEDIFELVGADGALREDLAADDGATLVFNGDYSLFELTGDRYVMKPGATALDLAAAAMTGLHVEIPFGVNIVVDNSAGVGLTIPQNGVRISGRGSITATNDGFDMLRSTGDDFWIDGVSLIGPGTYRPDLGGSGAPPSLLACRGNKPVVGKIKLVNPYGAGIFFRGSQGGKIVMPKITSAYAGGIAQPFLFQIFLYSCSDVLVFNPEIVGGIQGICGGGDGSGVVTSTDARGVTAATLRNVQVIGATCVNQLDHSVYFSNDTVNTKILNCPDLKSVNEPLKIEGGPNLVEDNTGEGGSGLIGRNVFKTKILNNHLTSTLNSVNAYGILLFDQVFKRPINDVDIAGNQLFHTAAVSGGAIYVIGDVWDGYQSQIRNVKIHHNTSTGHAGTLNGFQIGVRQNLFTGPPVTGVFGENVEIIGNVMEFPAHAVATYGIELSRGIRRGVVQGNTIIGFRSIGLRLLGVQDFEVSGNTFVMDSTATGVFGVQERQKDNTLHFDSLRNRYGENNYTGGTYTRTVQVSDETCLNRDRIILRRTGVLSADTIAAGQCVRHAIYNNHNAGAVITLDNLTTAPWSIDTEIIISNAHGANSLTVNPGGHVVTAGTSARLVCTGSNAFIKAN